MAAEKSDKVFAGSIPKFYDRYLVPLIFEPYAADLARRIGSMDISRVLEIAAGTGVVTRAMASLPGGKFSIVATDLNPAMLEEAAALGTARPVKWQQADAMALPFPDEEFDAVICQFGAMFFPDKGKAFAETRRVLKPGGVFIFNVWDRIEENEFADVVTAAVGELFPNDPPRFLARTPHGHHDLAQLKKDLAAGGFTNAPRIDTVTARSHAPSPREPSLAYCQGTPLRSEIEARDKTRLEEATNAGAAALERRFGAGAVDGKIQAHVIMVEK
jgi:ubiquinone/menaquinone biosynthesis C-methylase UbiE